MFFSLYIIPSSYVQFHSHPDDRQYLISSPHDTIQSVTTPPQSSSTPDCPIRNEARLNTTSTNPPPQHLQIPTIPPILPLSPLPLQHADRPPHPVSRAVLIPCPDLSNTSSRPSTHSSSSSSSTPPLHLLLPPLNRPIRRRKLVETLCGHGSGRELCRRAREVDEGRLEAVLLREMGQRRRDGGSCRGQA